MPTTPPLPPPTDPPNPTQATGLYPRRVVWLVLAAAALVLALWLLGTPPGVHGKAQAVGYAICHQIPARSFLINGEPLPLCARCTGIYLGVMTGLAAFALAGRLRASRLPPLRVLVLLGAFVLLTGLDGINSYLHLFPGYVGPYAPTNWLRLITGSLTGVTLINLVLPIFNTVTWAQPDPRRALNSFRELDALLLAVAAVDALVLLNNPTLLLVFGLVSAAGPLVVLTLAWGSLFLSFTRRENAVRTRRDLVLPLVAGFTLALLMIGGIDALRLALTGSWTGFDFSTLSAPPPT